MIGVRANNAESNVSQFVNFQNIGFGNTPPPSNVDSEMQVLGDILIVPQSIYKAKKAINSTDFYLEKHKIIFDVMDYLIGEIDTVDIFSLKNELSKMKKLEMVGGQKYLLELQKNRSFTANTAYHALLILESSIKRKAIISISKMYNSILQKENIVDVLYSTMHEFESLIEPNKDNSYTPEELAKYIDEEIEKRRDKSKPVERLFTGWKKIDELTGGFEPGDVVIVAGRTSMGKSHTITQLTYQWSVEQKIPGAYFTLEMSPLQLGFRQIQVKTGLQPNNLKNGNINDEEYAQTLEYNKLLSASKYYTEKLPGATVSQIKSKAKELKKRYGIKYIVIDHVGLANYDIPMSTKEQEMTKISNTLKKIAMELNIVVFELIQLNRSTVANKEHKPDLSNLRQSGAFEEDADTVLFVHRPEYYNIDSVQIGEKTISSERITELILAKNRNGNGTGSVYMKAQENSYRLRPLDPFVDDMEYRKTPKREVSVHTMEDNEDYPF